MQKMVIYKDLDGFKMTTHENYNARISNRRAVMDFSEFESVEQIIEYNKKYSNSFKSAAEIVIKNYDDKKITIIYLYEN